jgi:iron complex outermembrane receptor protein
LSGLQANVVPSNGNRSYLANVGDVRARGIEADGSWRVNGNLTIDANGSYNDATYSAYHNAPCPVGVTGICDLTGKPLYQAPKWIANATIDYHVALGALKPYVIAQYSYRSSTFGTVDDGPYSVIDAYGLFNFRVGTSFGKGRFDASVWINNALDKKYFQNLSTTAIVGASPFAFAGQLGTPRTAGVTLRASF